MTTAGIISNWVKHQRGGDSNPSWRSAYQGSTEQGKVTKSPEVRQAKTHQIRREWRLQQHRQQSKDKAGQPEVPHESQVLGNKI